MIKDMKDVAQQLLVYILAKAGREYNPLATYNLVVNSKGFYINATNGSTSLSHLCNNMELMPLVECYSYIVFGKVFRK